MTQTPSIGRIVHYHSYGTPGGEFKPEPRAAVITEVKTVSAYPQPVEVVGLAVLNPTGMFFNTGVHYSEEPKPGHWSWPPRA